MPRLLMTQSAKDVLAEAVIDLTAIAHNVKLLRNHAPSADLMAVVKADGYGHGAIQVAQTALQAGASHLGVATISEALELRQAGITAPILAWLYRPGTDFTQALQSDIHLAISSRQQLHEILTCAHQISRCAHITIKANTGMNRNGVDPGDFSDLLQDIQAGMADHSLQLHGLMSHLSCADDPYSAITRQQVICFDALIDHARRQGIDFEKIHLANSALIMTRPDLTYTMVRPGIALYGLSPLPQNGSMGFIPAMTLKSTIVMVRKLSAGQGISYGNTWIAPYDTTVALVPVGYADGIPRLLSGHFSVWINGRHYPNIGRICMDQFLIDLGPNTSTIQEGDDVILFGSGKHGEPLAQHWADALGTIHYEIVSGVHGRIARRYLS